MAELIDAATYAWRNDMPLTWACTFNLKRLETRPQAFISAFTKLAGDYLAIYSVPRAYLWVLERPPSKSLNCHLLIHVPESLIAAIARKGQSWTKKLAGSNWQKGMMRGERIGPMGRKSQPFSAGDYLNNLQPTLEYMLKGGNPKACDLLRLDPVNQGIIYGKRVGIAEAIGSQARKRAGYRCLPSERGAILFRHRYELEMHQVSSDQ